MEIPERVKIGGIIYTVRLMDNVSEEDRQVDGYILYDKQEIRIKKGMPEDYTGKVFLHEVLHGVLNFCALEQDEAIVERLANCLHQVLKDNKLHF